MKKLLLTLLLLAVVGCSQWAEMEAKAEKERQARIKQTDERKAMLKDGRVYIGMTETKFARLWEKPWHRWIDRSTSAYGVTEWWRYDFSCEPTYDRSYYHFCFENGILDYWSEN